MLRSTNANDVRCISWILWNITDPEALDAAIWLAGTVRWFEDGLDVESPYDQIVSTLKGCFDSNGKIYAGSRDRAYHSAQAVLWIHICAMCVSGEFGERFSLPTIAYDDVPLDPDLHHLLRICTDQDTANVICWIYDVYSEATSTHLQWSSNALLYLFWAKRKTPDTFNPLSWYYWDLAESTIPLNAVLNRLLVSCIFLGWPVDEGLLKRQDKMYAIYFFCHFVAHTLIASDYCDQILSQFSQAMAQDIHTSHPHCGLLPALLHYLCKSGNQSKRLIEVAYEWCSLICEDGSIPRSREDTVLLSLEIGFRHIKPWWRWIDAKLIHTEHHQKLANIVFSSGDDEAIADLLCAWTSKSGFHTPYPQLKICAEYLVGLHHLHPFSSRLQSYIVHAIGLIGYQQFEQVGVEGFARLLDGLQVCVEGICYELDPEGIQ